MYFHSCTSLKICNRMNEESRKDGGGESFETIKALVPFLTDLIPLILEKWSEIYGDRPSVRDIQQRQSRMGRRIKKLTAHMRWYRVFFILLLIWNIILTALLVIK